MQPGRLHPLGFLWVALMCRLVFAVQVEKRLPSVVEVGQSKRITAEASQLADVGEQSHLPRHQPCVVAPPERLGNFLI
jgi:hypothetical protein